MSNESREADQSRDKVLVVSQILPNWFMKNGWRNMENVATKFERECVKRYASLRRRKRRDVMKSTINGLAENPGRKSIYSVFPLLVC